ncbi:MAG: hypothetical protein AUG51_24575 [Acidobacteria bacterium 13_1_20CM_3_53_8]|nr:MAG: hypothetical protein AUG51_24575 [Acidobacteria bacterium 13_1_20CM_3_53_8]
MSGDVAFYWQTLCQPPRGSRAASRAGLIVEALYARDVASDSALEPLNFYAFHRTGEENSLL